jgi:tRNA A-37 threonylcarbamoyl transferase component Bud32
MIAVAARKTADLDAFRELAIGPWRVVVAEAIATPFEQAARSLRLEEHEDLRSLGAASSSIQGRGRNSILDLPGTSTRLHVRALVHGGILARLTGTRFSSLERPIAELQTTAALARCGAPVPKPGFVMGRRRGWFWQAAVGSVHEDGTMDGVAYLESNPDRASLERAARTAGGAVRRLHDLGCRHADLQIKNLLIRNSRSTSEVIIVDLDRARLDAELTPKRRMLELMRLHRSLQKRGLREALHARTQAAFFSAYLRGDPKLRHRMLAHQWFEGLRLRVHALLYPRS